MGPKLVVGEAKVNDLHVHSSWCESQQKKKADWVFKIERAHLNFQNNAEILE